MFPADLPTILADDLRLRPVRIPEDVVPALAWFRDPEVLFFSEGADTPPWDSAMVERMFREMTTRCEVYIVEVLHGGAWHAIGDASLCRTAGTPITIGDAAWRSRGVGRLVLAMLIGRARDLGWARMVVSGIFEDNVRALRLYRGAGFQETGRIGEDEGRSKVTMELPLTS